MGILTTNTPPRREQIARRVIAVLAYGGTLLMGLALMTAFLWFIIPDQAWHAKAAKARATLGTMQRVGPSKILDHEIKVTDDFRLNVRSAAGMKMTFDSTYLKWIALLVIIFLACSALPLLGWMAWMAASRKRKKLLGSPAVRGDLATTGLSPDEVLRPRLLECDRAALRPFLVISPVAATLILLWPRFALLPLLVSPGTNSLDFNSLMILGDTLKIAIRLDPLAALTYLVGLVLLLKFFAPYLMMTRMRMRCLPASTPDASQDLKRIVLQCAAICAGVLFAAWGLRDALSWLSDDLGDRLFSKAFPELPRYSTTAFDPLQAALTGVQITASTFALAFLPRWALRRQWREALANYYWFE